MAASDPIADFLTIIRNGAKAKFKYVDVPASNLKKQITKLLVEQGYLKKFIVVNDEKQGLIRIWIKYDPNGDSIINKIQRVSRPGRRVYTDISTLPRVKNNLGIAILTTPQGVMTAREALRNNVGGEVLCYVW